MSTAEKYLQILNILLTEYDVAARVNVSVGTVRRWRLLGRGPRYKKIGGLVRYEAGDVEEWLQSRPTGGGGK